MRRPATQPLSVQLRIANRNVSKCVLKELGVIASDRIRGPMPSYWDAVSRRQFMDHIHRVGVESLGVPMRSGGPTVRVPRAVTAYEAAAK